MESGHESSTSSVSRRLSLALKNPAEHSRDLKNSECVLSKRRGTHGAEIGQLPKSQIGIHS
jgi:hypothetical protein